jgi:hypothetical protein
MPKLTPTIKVQPALAITIAAVPRPPVAELWHQLEQLLEPSEHWHL